MAPVRSFGARIISSLLSRLIISFFFLSSCADDQIDNPPAPVVADHAFFPVDSGFTRIYEVDSIYWDAFTGNHDTVSYELKEVMAGIYIDNQGRKGQRIERYKKDDNGNWIIYRVWSSLLTATTAEVTEENIRYIKLTFPVAVNESWNGNAFNAEGALNYTYQNTGGEMFGGFNFPETATVIQDNDPPNLLEDKYGEERYAKGTGIYYRKNLWINFRFPDPTPFNGPDTASGHIYTEKLIEVQ